MQKDTQDTLGSELKYFKTLSKFVLNAYEKDKKYSSKKLKEFIGSTLDEGLVCWHIKYDDTAEINYAKQFSSLYNQCENETFKETFENITLNLLYEEFEKDFTKVYASSDNSGKISQLNRMQGLLEVISWCENTKKFKESINILTDNKYTSVFETAQSLSRCHYEFDIYNQILLTISSVQKGSALKNFWIENIENSTTKRRTLSSLRGLMRSYETKTDLKKDLPHINNMFKDLKYDSIRHGINLMIRYYSAQ